MTYLREIIWLISWPLTILLCMWLINIVLKKVAKKESNEESAS